MDTLALKKAFSTLLERHEALRTTFIEIEGEPQQQILSVCDFSINEIEINHLEDIEEQTRILIEQEANTVFDLTKPPLLRATLIKLAENRYLFILTIHHIIGDGWSMTVLY